MSRRPITPEQFVRAVDRSGKKRTDVANLLGTSRANFYKYIDNGVTDPTAIANVRRKLGLWLLDDDGSPYAGFSDKELLAEIENRLTDLRVALVQSTNAVRSEEITSTEAPTEEDEGGLGTYSGTGEPPPGV